MSPTERYQPIVQIMDEAYRSYEDGLVALRKRVVDGRQVANPKWRGEARCSGGYLHDLVQSVSAKNPE